MNIEESLGYYSKNHVSAEHDEKVLQYINLKLAALGLPTYGNDEDSEFLQIAHSLISHNQEKDRLLSNYLCAADRRIQSFLNDFLGETSAVIPSKTFILDRHGLSRMLSVPPNRDSFISPCVESYRVQQGVLHNPIHDRRTTQGVFHITEGGLPIPDDKIAVPKFTFAKLLKEAFNPPIDLKLLPFTSAQKDQAEVLLSLLLRPIVCPEAPGLMTQKTMEIRFFAPGSLVSNLDFVESIFGNAGDPYLPENDAGLDVEHWTGHTGCVILAPHLIKLRKKDLGLPNIKEATERQKRDGMCWQKESDLYNNGTAFKITCRDERGVMVTVIADNYFGYCKKEVKTQISFSANLYGFAEEEHAGGAVAFPAYDLGEDFDRDAVRGSKYSFKDVVGLFGHLLHLKPEGYAVDRQYNDVLYVPEDAHFDLSEQGISWTRNAKDFTIPLLKNHTYFYPSGYRVRFEKDLSGTWRLVGTVGDGTLCHKPCTVSGGGKSEISKSIEGNMIQGPMFTSDFEKDFMMITDILNHDFGDRFREQFKDKRQSRPILSPRRSLGSVIKLLTPSPEYTDAYNAWLELLPYHIKELIFVIKRFYKPEWGTAWKKYFSVDVINGKLGHELKYENRKLIAHYLRVGHEKNGSWRIYKLRQDFCAADKLQVEDDITASVVVSRKALQDLSPQCKNPSVKLVQNCEYRLFQRPDDAVIRGMDQQAELDLSSAGTFLSNFEPLNRKAVEKIAADAIGFDEYTRPVKKLVNRFLKNNSPDYLAVSSLPRIVNGKPTKNPRYLQNRPDMADPRSKYIAEMGIRLFRKIPSERQVPYAVDAVLPGRRNNPPDKKNKIPPLAVYNPIHYQELPELFMDFICSVTGKSPSTTGFGSEGALTKGPFNALWPVVDLNNALVSYILTGYQGFSSAAGYVGPNIRVDHDISFLIPEIWCRMSVKERDPKYLIREGFLERVQDFNYKGEKISASLLGYRITLKFVNAFLGRIFSHPNVVFNTEMLAPEKQDMKLFVEGLKNLVATQKHVAKYYFNDGSYEVACPPLKALLSIMVKGSYEGKDQQDPEIRKMFQRDYLLKSDWYQERLKMKQTRDVALWNRNIRYLNEFISLESHKEATRQLKLRERLKKSREHLKHVQSTEFLSELVGTIGADPLHGQVYALDAPTLVAADDR